MEDGSYYQLFALLILSPLPAVLTWNWFQPARTMTLFAIFALLIGVGIVKILDSLTRIFGKIVKTNLVKTLAFLALVIFGLVSTFYLFDSINIYLPTRDPGNWQPGFKETVPVVMELAENYSQVIIETPHAQPYIFYLFYAKYPPDKYLREVDFEFIGTPRKHYDFGKFKFRKIYWPDDRNLKNTLFVGNEQNLPQRDLDQTLVAKTLTEIKDRWGNVIHKLVAIE